MKYLNNIIYLFFISIVIFSCTKSTEPLSKEKNYNVNITYIEDDGINSFEPKDFIDIFDDDLSKLTYEILGYKIKYNLKNGTDDRSFYRANRSIILNNAYIFKRDFIDIRNIDYNVLENDIKNSLSNETSMHIKNMFGYDYGTPLEIIAKNIAPSYIESILSVWNSPVKSRNELLVGSRFMMYTALYWRIVAEEFEDSAIVIVNIPIAANYRGMSAKSIADGGFVDRIVVENNHIKPCKSIAVISIYNFLNSDMDNETIKKMFSYYIVQTMAMMFPKYDIDREEKHSIMSEVKGFDYFNWYSNIINFQLKTPYKTIKEYKDTIKR
ncbi:hypothetical protein [uncultured Brachyspira sp.]|uniref:hypothetical protein n=1 Tax=uncultured Brachyspira sp. TaxID=221953 RepID=UPI00261DA283|nr:hypothetical protein [uncultured Brachyspira sp.]